MTKKDYNGIEVERIMFDQHLETSYPTNIQSGCYLGSVTLHTSDANNNPLPAGVCWDDSAEDPDDQYIYLFIEKTTRD